MELDDLSVVVDLLQVGDRLFPAHEAVRPKKEDEEVQAEGEGLHGAGDEEHIHGGGKGNASE